ncbi:MAG: hypothetical protein HZA68_05035 [Rhodovulum sp.]|nr:hypothetical protein [Rhodovulum sp.]
MSPYGRVVLITSAMVALAAAYTLIRIRLADRACVTAPGGDRPKTALPAPQGWRVPAIPIRSAPQGRGAQCRVVAPRSDDALGEHVSGV